MRISDWSSDVCYSDLEQQQLGLSGQHHGKLQLALLAVGHIRGPGVRPRLQAHAVESREGRFGKTGLAHGGRPETKTVALVRLYSQHDGLQAVNSGNTDVIG